MDILCAWGVTLQYFVESFFPYFLVPSVSQAVVYTARRKHPWSLSRYVMPQQRQRQLKKGKHFHYFVESFFLVFSSAQRSPMVVLRTTGGTSMVVFEKMTAGMLQE